MIRIIYEVKIGPHTTDRRVGYVSVDSVEYGIQLFQEEYALSRPHVIAAELIQQPKKGRK